MFKRLSDTIHISHEEASELLDFIKHNRIIVYHGWEKKKKNESTATHAFIKVGKVNVTITVRNYKKDRGTKTYQFRLDDEKIVEETRAPGLMAELGKVHKVHNLAKTATASLLGALNYGKPGKNGGRKFGLHSKAYSTTKLKPELAMRRLYNVWYYDINSFYPYIFADKIPQTEQMEFIGGGFVPKGWIGFSIIDGEIKLRNDGERAIWRMPLIDSPWRSLVLNWFEKKQKARDVGDIVTEARYKSKLNALIGTFQYVNPFIYAYVVLKGRQIMKSLVDENTVVVHTDSIISLKERQEFTVGEGLGEWKVKHLESFVFNSHNDSFQENFEPPNIKGIPKSLFKKGWDMTKDPLPIKGVYPWRLDKENTLLERNPEYESIYKEEAEG